MKSRRQRPSKAEILLAAGNVGDCLGERSWRRETVGSGSVAGRIITNQDHRRLVILIRDRESQRFKYQTVALSLSARG